MRFSPGINVCKFDGCVSCARDGPLSGTLKIIRLNPLNQTFAILIIVPPSPSKSRLFANHVSRTAYWHNKTTRAAFFRPVHLCLSRKSRLS